MKRALAALLLLAGGSALAVTEMPAPRAAAQIDIEGPIGPATSGYFEKALQRAQAQDAALVLLKIDTPGGLDSAMRDIIKRILASKIPVVGYVAPGGARAASAGTYILYACHVAAMAPATNLGAATPVPVGGSWDMKKSAPEDTDEAGPPHTSKPGKPDKSAHSDESAHDEPTDAMGRKIVNDAVAYIRGLAQQRGRNADWAEAAVREGRSLSAEQALKEHVVDLLAADDAELLKKLDGRRVQTAGGDVTLRTTGLTVEKIEPDWRMRMLAVLTNPTVAYLLMLAGIWGLLLEGYHPGAILPGTVGGICALLALYAFQVLPVNYVGLALILLGVGLMVAETMVPGVGALGVGGVIAFVTGSLLLMDIDVPGFDVNLGVIGGIAAGAAATLALTLWLVWRARRAPVVTGSAAMHGRHGKVLEVSASEPGEGWAEIGGERWRVQSSRPLAVGQHVRVLRMDGLTLKVEPKH